MTYVVDQIGQDLLVTVATLHKEAMDRSAFAVRLHRKLVTEQQSGWSVQKNDKHKLA